MPSKVRIEITPGAIQEILKSAEVQADLRDRAERIASAAGSSEDYEVDTRVGRTRARASVRTASFEAMRDEAENRTLTRALDAGR
ncbi:hypothetical protein EDF38_1306 [Frigoribacterium sp. PhB160]|uniref:hypothetical protein n=1 Tax=Frigoribacterium sp. PhB160 TaxID=2485192 RepID=UPI000F47C2DD|nr:hypothetical protein [Frigoribacterium sp. PhB160]ROS62203.1 hypothetical protein EDF38_1306 [Frigoribacterium sp. PhB160]